MAAMKELLILFGGSTSSPGDIQPESQCVKIGSEYYLNELHVYNLKTSECISSEYILQVDLGIGWESCKPPLTSHSIIVINLEEFILIIVI